MPAAQGHLLIVDDDPDILLSAQLLLKRQFARVSCLAQPSELPAFLHQENVDLILLDMNFTLGDNTGTEGFYWLEQLQRTQPQTLVVLMTAYAGVELAVAGIKAGAVDFVIKPWNNDKLIATLQAAMSLAQAQAHNRQLCAENRTLRASLTPSADYFIGETSGMNQLKQRVALCAPTEANVLILGENGAGKELVARAIHAQSQRADHIFMAIDMGAIAENLFEAELFGHRKGAFTGAEQARTGRLVAANGGTVFLDEIANLPLHLQVKLLRVLEQRQVTPLGEEKPVALDVRVIAATNAHYELIADETRFRQDLLYRLNTIELTVPPLRERREDIPLLVDHYLGYYAQKYQRRKPALTAAALRALCAYDWPGNVRSLRHALERAIILSGDQPLQLDDFALPQANSRAEVDSGMPNNLNLEELERTAVARALKQFSGNISQAAKALGITRTALYRRMEKHDL